MNLPQRSPKFATYPDAKGICVGFICMQDPTDPAVLSGSPYHMLTHLAKLGAEVVPIFPITTDQTTLFLSQLRARLPTALKRNHRVKAMWKSMQQGTALIRSRVDSHDQFAKSVNRANAIGQELSQQLASLDNPVDVLFGVCISTPLYALNTDLPIVYFSDATARLLQQTYPEYQKQPAGTKRAGEMFEQSALGRIFAGIFPSDATLNSAVEHYGLPKERAHLVPMGSSVVPNEHDSIAPDLPTRERLELIIVAADPIRKRLDLCVDVTKILAARGWNVTLHSIGGSTPSARKCDRVRVHGRLSLADPIDRDIHKAMLRRSHFMLLPSLGEMFGIAPGEAAHFGRPSLVSATGGLTTVVQHGTTGLCLPVDAPPEHYADEIERISNKPALYRAMSDAALERAQTVLSWEQCARSTLRILYKAADKKCLL